MHVTISEQPFKSKIQQEKVFLLVVNGMILDLRNRSTLSIGSVNTGELSVEGIFIVRSLNTQNL